MTDGAPITLAKPGASDVQWFMPGARRAFAGSPKATSDLIKLIAEDTTLTVSAGVGEIHFDDDATGILRGYVDAGYGDDNLADLLANKVERRRKTELK